MSPARIFAAGIASAAGLALLAYASGAPLASHGEDAARLRLSWSARPERIEVCRQLSAEEQARRGEHMRQRVECEGGFATYALRVEVDDRAIGETVIRGAGLRHDRPLYLLKDYAVSPGPHRFKVALTRRESADTGTVALSGVAVPEADTGLYAGRAQREAVERARRTRAAIPATLVLDTALTFAPGRVVLVTFNAERRLLELRTESRRP
ncbi:MAG: hypothetical protein HOP28_03930 [Gemmatimonadales bacterium]|nr:hypothetical protein [Gemmatimonadales bacterium]